MSLNPPFGERFDLFDYLEHRFFLRIGRIRGLAKAAGLEVLNSTETLWFGAEIAIFRKPS